MTYTKNSHVTDHPDSGKSFEWPTNDEGCPSGFYKATTVCAHGCGPKPITVTVTLPIKPSYQYGHQEGNQASATWNAWTETTVPAEATSTWAEWVPSESSGNGDDVSTWANWAASPSSDEGASVWATWTSPSSDENASTWATWSVSSSSTEGAPTWAVWSTLTTPAAETSTWATWPGATGVQASTSSSNTWATPSPSNVKVWEGAASSTKVKRLMVIIGAIFAGIVLL